jgi:hypothetical protein
MSPIQQAQKADRGARADGLVPVHCAGASDQPQVADNIDGDEIVRDMPDMFNTRTSGSRARKCRRMRDQRAKIAQAQAAIQGGQGVADVVKTAVIPRLQDDQG